MKTKKFTKNELSWILYDVGNSAYVLILVTTLLPLYFKEVAAKGAGIATFSFWGYANAAASLILALSAPFLGALSDFKGMKSRLFNIFFGCGIAVTLLFTLPRPGNWLPVFLLIILGRVSWSGSLLFYDAFITDVTDTDKMDRLSAHGYAWGYIGAVIPFIMALVAVYLTSPGPSIAVTEAGGKISFLIVAIWWAVFTIPMLKNVRQKNYIQPEKNSLLEISKQSFKNLISTLRNISRYRNIVLFLGAYFFYIDGVSTIISMAVAFGNQIGLSTLSMIGAVLLIQILAFPFAILFGKMADRWSTKRMISIGIVVYIFITFTAFFLGKITSVKTQTIVFWIMAFLVSTSMGGIQSLSRSLFAKIIPPEISGEFFGFYNIFGKFAAILGPFIMGIVSQLTGKPSLGVLGLLPFFVIGIILLSQVRENEGIRI